MESTFVIARKPKCRHDVRHEPFTRTERPPLHDQTNSGLDLEAGSGQELVADDSDAEIVLI